MEASISASFSSRSASSKVPPKGGELRGELIEALAGFDGGHGSWSFQELVSGEARNVANGPAGVETGSDTKRAGGAVSSAQRRRRASASAPTASAHASAGPNHGSRA